jgi:hypothetical protein
MKWIGRSSSGEFSESIALGEVLIGRRKRLKKVQGKKKRDVAAREAERAATQGVVDELVVTSEPINVADGGGDLLSTKDEDVIF